MADVVGAAASRRLDVPPCPALGLPWLCLSESPAYVIGEFRTLSREPLMSPTPGSELPPTPGADTLPVCAPVPGAGGWARQLCTFLRGHSDTAELPQLFERRILLMFLNESK